MGGGGGGGGGEEAPYTAGLEASQPVNMQEMMQAMGNDPQLRQWGHEGTQRSLNAVGQNQQGLQAGQGMNMMQQGMGGQGLLNNQSQQGRPMGPVQRGLLSPEQMGIY